MKRILTFCMLFFLGVSATMAASEEFCEGIPRERLEHYLSRAITQGKFCNPASDAEFEENLRMVKNIGARFIGRAAFQWGPVPSDEEFFKKVAHYAERTHEEMPDAIIQCCVFEAVYKSDGDKHPYGVDKVPVPAWVFKEFGLPVQKRNFRYEDMLYKDGKFVGLWGGWGSCPDITRLETQMYFYYLAKRYIDAGYEAIHFGQVLKMGMNCAKTGYQPWFDLLARVRRYAKDHARRGWVICDAHAGYGLKSADGHLLLDFHSFPLRPEEITGKPYPTKPYQTQLSVGHLDAIYKKSKGGITPSGWKCESLPYLVELDNSGSDKGFQGRSDNPTEIWPWGWDEITWFAHCDQEYRNYWLLYADQWIRKNDPNGHLQVPGCTTIAADPLLNEAGEKIWMYRINTPSEACPDGFGQEETVRKMWMDNEDAIYKDADAPIKDRVADLISRMTLEEKVMILSGVWNQFTPIFSERLGIPRHNVVHGPYGFSDLWLPVGHLVNGTLFPASIAIASTWDTDLVRQLTKAMGKEIHAWGGEYVAGPAMNIIRDPRGGRSFEYFTEDPYLNGKIAAAYVQGVQSEKVLATIKHFVCNNQEWDRFSINANVDERSLREIYLPGYEMAIKEGDAKAVMTAYNRLNGIFTAEQPLTVKQILRGEWGFDGLVMSDWGGTHSTLGTAENGLDLEMASPKVFGSKLLQEIYKGNYTEEGIDVKVRHYLEALFWTGAFDEKPSLDESILRCEEHLALSRKAAEESMVLLKNEKHTLPFKADEIKKLALIGPSSCYGIHYNNGEFKPQLYQGGGSASTHPEESDIVTPLQGLQEKFGDRMEINFAPGCYAESGCGTIPSKYVKTPDGKQEGFLVEYYGNCDWAGDVVKREVVNAPYFEWGRELPIPELRAENGKLFSVKCTGILTVPESREYLFEVRNEAGDGRLYIDDRLVVANVNANRTDWNATAKVYLEAGKTYAIRGEYASKGSNVTNFRMSWDYENVAWMKEALALAEDADAVVLAVGLTGNMGESENADRRDLNLPASQVELINAVCAANPHTAVVLHAGSAVTMKGWLENVPALLNAQYPGQEEGHALADILFGDVNPSGRLTITYPESLSQYPENYYVRANDITYDEGVFVGYRYFDKHDLKPLFPFGYGLSYTDFKYSGLKVDASDFEKTGIVKVSVKVKNVGKMEGADVVQLYVGDKECKVARPSRELKGFKRVTLRAGETKVVEFSLDRRSFSFWDDDLKAWNMEPGRFDIMIGKSVEEICLNKKLVLE